MKKQRGFLAPGGAQRRPAQEKLPSGREFLANVLTTLAIGALGIVFLKPPGLINLDSAKDLVDFFVYAASWVALFLGAFGLLAVIMLRDEYRWK
jgi:hypothetical protein